MRNLYLATSPQIFYDIFKHQFGLFFTSLERGKILSVFCQGFPNRFIHQFGNASISAAFRRRARWREGSK